MGTIPDRGKRDPDIAALLLSLRRSVTFEAAEAEVDPAACARLVRWYDAQTGEPLEAHDAQAALDDEIADLQATAAPPAPSRAEDRDETRARLAALRRDDDPFWLRAQLRRVEAARCLWQLAACFWFACWLLAVVVVAWSIWH